MPKTVGWRSFWIDSCVFEQILCPNRAQAGPGPGRTRAWASGDIAGARALHTALYPLFKVLFVETNPVPVKAAIEWHTGLPTTATRLPLTPLEAGSVDTLRTICGRLGIGA